MARNTRTPWHVAAIDTKQGRIVGDETGVGWDRLQILGANATVASVYRAGDARTICTAVNCHDALLAVVEELADLCPRMSDDDPAAPAIADAIKRARTIIKSGGKL